MSWLLEFRPEVGDDVAESASWYDAREAGLGREFVSEVVAVWQQLATDPMTGSRGRREGLRWRYADRFPYRVIYTVDEARRSVLVVAVLHAARADHHWRNRSERQ